MQRVVQLLARDAGLDRGVEVLGVDGDDRGSCRDRSTRDAAARRQHVAFERSADAVGDDRHAVFGAQADDQRDFFGAFGHDDAVGQQRLMDRFVAAVLQAGRFAAGKTRAETLGKALPECFRQGGAAGYSRDRKRVALSRSPWVRPS